MSETPTRKRTRAPRAPQAPRPEPKQPVEMHALFALSKNPDPLPAPIEAIDVYRKAPDGRTSMIRWVAANQLPDEMALEAQFGPGDYHLIGRDITRTIICRRIDVTVGDIASPAVAASASPAPQVIERRDPSADFFALLIRDMQESRKETVALVTAFAERGEKQTEGVIRAITSAFSARAADQQAIIEGLAKSKGGGLDPDKALELVREGMAMQAAAAETAAATEQGVDELELIKTGFEAFKAAKALN